jgi:hypothetical protein
MDWCHVTRPHSQGRCGQGGKLKKETILPHPCSTFFSSFFEFSVPCDVTSDVMDWCHVTRNFWLVIDGYTGVQKTPQATKWPVQFAGTIRRH